MAIWQDNNQVTARFECEYTELPDRDQTRKTLELAPVTVFGKEAFASITDTTENDPETSETPEAAQATFVMSKMLYTLMIRFQQGAEAAGDDPPPWALVEDTAIEIATGRVLETGEVFPLY